jgi:hypothetical protein
MRAKQHANDVQQVEWNMTNHSPNADQVARIEAMRDVGKALGRAFASYGVRSRELSLAQTKLEEALMWAVASVARADTES